MKRCPTLLFKEIQIEMTTRYYFNPLEELKSKTDNTKCRQESQFVGILLFFLARVWPGINSFGEHFLQQFPIKSSHLDGTSYKESASQCSRHKRYGFGSGRSPGVGSGNPLQYFCLESSTGRGGWWATVNGATKSQARLSTYPMTQHKYNNVQVLFIISWLENHTKYPAKEEWIMNCHIFIQWKTTWQGKKKWTIDPCDNILTDETWISETQ